VVAVGREVPDVVEADRYQSPVDGPFDDALAQRARKHRRKEGEDVEVDAMKGVNLILNDFLARFRRIFAVFVLGQQSDSSAGASTSQPSSTSRQTARPDSILTHERGTAQVIVPDVTRSRPHIQINAIRIGVALAVVASSGWPVWTRGVADDNRSPLEVDVDNKVPISEPGTILGLRPTFTPTPAAAETPLSIVDTSELAQIVIVTPTPDPRRALTVAGAVIDRPFAVADTKRANIGLMGLLPIDNVTLPPASQSIVDLSTLRIPPMVEEVVSAPVTQIKIVTFDGVELELAEAPEPVLAPALTLAPEPTAVARVIPPLVITGPTRIWSSFQPKPPEENDHFWVESPFLNTEYNKVAAPSYQFGSTAGGQYRPHHGIDIANRWGTPVRAATSGEVVFAGLDDPIPMGPYPNFYGNTVVIKLDRKLPVAGGEIDVFVLYGHLSRVTVEQGQRVEPNDIVGEVGMTGIAIGPHLHFEIRVGENTYKNSVNAYLWLQPAPGDGAVAVRLVTADGRSWPGARLTLARFENGRAVWGRMIETYLDNENIGPNPSWGENGAMGDVPAGYYVLIGNVNGEAVRAEFFVRDGQTTFVEIRTKQ
jgi:murein DD-endopeptidase MepM/ murein hydrolase activator NlpD